MWSLFKVIVAGIARDAAVKSGPADDAAWFDARAVRKPIEMFCPARIRIHPLASAASLGHTGSQGDVAEWLKAAVC